MSLAPHEIRMMEEQAQLTGRIDKLVAFVHTGQFQEMATEDRMLLLEQLSAMQQYGHVLNKRISRFAKDDADDFALPAKACDLSGEGTCEACQ